ncbi:MAG: L-threonylcarbamoyladenylate synthase [Methanosarcinaceae archaeon]|nr:L-threonylcarbamoyladenylate synthase [Methanosarcinaceae archaeon]
MNNKTLVFKIDESNFADTISKAADIIKQGGTVAFPTETVYGLGADALDPVAVRKIFEAKGRPADNPLIVHIASRDSLDIIAKDIPPIAFELMDAFWPGPLTLVLKRTSAVPDITTGGLDTVAVRMPDNPVALALIKVAGTPLAAPSANTSGRPSPTTAEHVISDLSGRIDAVIDGGAVEVGVESTVLDVTSDVPAILRPGGVSLEDIKKYVGEVVIGYTDQAVEEGDVVRSPGMKYTHYSPKTRVVLVEGDGMAVAAKISELIDNYSEKNMRVGLLITDETAEHVSADEMYSLGRRDKPEDAARNLFAGLRYLDERDVDISVSVSVNVNVIIVDGSIKCDGVGVAVLNRLRKAANELIEV